MKQNEKATDLETEKAVSSLKTQDVLKRGAFKHKLAGDSLIQNLTIDSLLEAKRMVEIGAMIEKISHSGITQATIASEVTLVQRSTYAWDSNQFWGTVLGQAAFFRPILAGVDVIKNPDTTSTDYVKGLNGQTSFNFPLLDICERYSAVFVSVGRDDPDTKTRFKKWRATIKKKGDAVKKFMVVEFEGESYLLVFRYMTPMEAMLKKAPLYGTWAKYGFEIDSHDKVADTEVWDRLAVVDEYMADAGSQKINLGFGAYLIQDFYGTIPAALTVYFDSILPAVHNTLSSHILFVDLATEALKHGINQSQLVIDLSIIDPGKSICSIIKSGVGAALKDSVRDPQQDNFASLLELDACIRRLVPQTLIALR